MNGNARRSMAARMVGAARFDTTVYDEVEHDGSATGQAAGVVAIAALFSAVGGIGGGAQAALAGLIAALFGWLLWAGITYLIGDKLLGGTATWGELLRTLGFAQAPGVFFCLAAVPVIGSTVAIIIAIWLLLTGIVAIRQALDFGTGRTILTAVLGAIPYAALRLLLGA